MILSRRAPVKARSHSDAERLSPRVPHGTRATRVRVHLHPQRRTVVVAGRRSVGRLLPELGILPSTAMVIRGDELLTDGEMVEESDEIEIRAVISGGAT